ncbi:LAMI_0H01992g1_1 [Lachancea mirantina]|uniref:LAMI_0H01992g1_1 n=1 Tax=Lachancea mirantina TaxID=1230905 RepID=A0A1G4KE00_9SACH|nr:LAMI_0H01992g1_1 [Lachancea mirantina]
MESGFPPNRAHEIVHKISQLLEKRNETIAVSEAACGGLMSSYLVSVPGASSWFHGGTTVYSLKSRLKLSGWSEEDIQNYTGPSVEVALRLARNLKFELGATYTLSETGFASDSSRFVPKSKTQSVGTVYLGLSGPSRDLSEVFNSGSTNRCHNMQEFAIHGLEFLLKEIEHVDRASQPSSSEEEFEPELVSKKQKLPKK